MTTHSPTPVPLTPLPRDGESAAKLFWLSRLEGDVHKATIVPDRRRTAQGRRQYRSIPFALEPEVIRVLKSQDVTRGVSDVVLCAGLVAVLLAKYHREDELMIGLRLAIEGADAGVIVPVRLLCAPDATVSSVMTALAAEIAETTAWSALGFAGLEQVMGESVNEGRCPFFDIAVAVGTHDAPIDMQAYPVDFAFVFDATAGSIRGHVHYAAELYDETSAGRLVAQLLSAARQIGERPGSSLRDVQILSPHERGRIFVEFKGRTLAFPLDATIHALFERQAHQAPAAIAVIHGDSRLSYSELNRRANRLANVLLSLGLTKGAFVGILLDRGCDFLVAMLGVFKAGGAYVPLDPTYPRERVRYMVDDSQAPMAITNAALLDAFADVFDQATGLRVILSLQGAIETLRRDHSRPGIELVGPESLAKAPDHDPSLGLQGTDRAYMIYTSGSSGRPKGAICRHDGALNHLFGELDGVGIACAFSFLQTAASSSDISVWQFVAPLLYGGATIIADYDVVVDPVQLFAAIKRQQVTLAELVPVLLRALLDHVAELPAGERPLPALRCMMCTGEGLATELVDRWLAFYPGIPLANTYGPTETSDDVTLLVMRQPIADRWAVAPIGRALPNLSLFVLDRDLTLLPVGVPGEICVAGIGVGEGYWRQPDKTAAAFVTCPFPEVATGLMYRTGDLGRWLDDGSIEFLGRIDQQVKVRGFRVEPGEIEDSMTKHPGVQGAAVVAIDDAAGNKRLVGYFVPHKGQSLSAADLRQFLKGSLAEHMVPAVLAPLAALPLTPLGKLDRKALSRLEYLKDSENDSFLAPRNDVEALLAAAWKSVLGLPRIGMHDNFFEIGGDSMSTLRVIAELKRCGLRVTPKQLFVHPTIAKLAAYIGALGHSNEEPAGLPDAAVADKAAQWAPLRRQLQAGFPDIDDAYPLSAAQRAIYFHSILASRNSGAYIEQIAFDLTGSLDEDLFALAWQHAIDTTDVLRTAVVRRGTPQPAQVVFHSASLALERLDWRQRTVSEQQQALDKLQVQQRMCGFDLKSPPLMRITLARLAPQRWRVLWTYHHLILDGWSEPLVLGGVFRAYDALLGKHDLPPAPASRYRDFVAWTESQDMGMAERFWREQLAGFSHPVSIKDHSPAIQPPTSLEASHGSHERSLSAEESSGLENMARRNRLTLSTLIHGAWALLLHHRTTSTDVVFGSVVSGRQCDCPGVDRIRGLLVVTQPLRTRLVADATVPSWLRLVQLQMAEMREHEHTPLASIQQWCEESVGKRPLFDAIVVVGNYEGSDLASSAPNGLLLANVAYATQPLYALTLFIVMGARLSVRLVYDKRRYAHDTVVRLLDEFFGRMAAMAENPEQRLAGLLAAPA